jgi:hypothetical protein
MQSGSASRLLPARALAFPPSCRSRTALDSHRPHGFSVSIFRTPRIFPHGSDFSARSPLFRLHRRAQRCGPWFALPPLRQVVGVVLGGWVSKIGARCWRAAEVVLMLLLTDLCAAVNFWGYRVSLPKIKSLKAFSVAKIAGPTSYLCRSRGLQLLPFKKRSSRSWRGES